jgi:hypothetical protein
LPRAAGQHKRDDDHAQVNTSHFSFLSLHTLGSIIEQCLCQLRR